MLHGLWHIVGEGGRGNGDDLFSFVEPTFFSKER